MNKLHSFINSFIYVESYALDELERILHKRDYLTQTEVDRLVKPLWQNNPQKLEEFLLKRKKWQILHEWVGKIDVAFPYAYVQGSAEERLNVFLKKSDNKISLVEKAIEQKKLKDSLLHLMSLIKTLYRAKKMEELLAVMIGVRGGSMKIAKLRRSLKEMMNIYLSLKERIPSISFKEKVREDLVSIWKERLANHPPEIHRLAAFCEEEKCLEFLLFFVSDPKSLDILFEYGGNTFSEWNRHFFSDMVNPEIAPAYLRWKEKKTIIEKALPNSSKPVDWSSYKKNEGLKKRLLSQNFKDKAGEHYEHPSTFGPTWTEAPVIDLSHKELLDSVTKEVDSFVDLVSSLQPKEYLNRLKSFLKSPYFDRLPIIALKACEQGKLLTEDYATFSMYWAAVRDFARGKIDEKVTFLDVSDPDFQTYMKEKALFLAEKPEKSARELTHESSCLKRAILKIELPKNPAEWPQLFMNISKEGLLPFTPFTVKDKSYLYVVPFSIMQKTLVANFQEDAMTMIPQIGLCSWQQMAEMLEADASPFALFVNGMPKPFAHNLQSKFYAVIIHDFYHAFIKSSVGKDHRGCFLQLYKTAEKDQVPSSEIAREFSSQLIDMDFPGYLNCRLDPSSPSKEAFSAAFYRIAQNSNLTKNDFLHYTKKVLAKNSRWHSLFF